MKTVLVALVLALTGCATSQSSSTPAATTTATPTRAPAASSTTADASGVPWLEDGPVAPGRYRFAVLSTCDPQLGCPVDEEPPLPTLEITVPDGWEAATEFVSLFPAPGRDTTSPNDPAIALGWTNQWVGLNSQPCSAVSHQKPDIEVGPTADDFVDAVVAHPLLDVTKPQPVRLGEHRGWFLSLFGPEDISGCEEWRPWDPSPYLQGPANRWDLWVVDVDGVRVVVLAQYFPQTPARIKRELRAMAESVRFAPGTPR